MSTTTTAIRLFEHALPAALMLVLLVGILAGAPAHAAQPAGNYERLHQHCVTLASFAVAVANDRQAGDTIHDTLDVIDAGVAAGNITPVAAQVLSNVARIVHTEPHLPPRDEAQHIYQACIGSAIEVTYSY